MKFKYYRAKQVHYLANFKLFYEIADILRIFAST